MAHTFAFEGLPGCGKSTVIEMVKADPRLQNFKIAALDIDSSPDAPVIRPIADAYSFKNPARMLLFWVLRIQQYDVIQQRRNNTDIFLLDRFLGSLWAYDIYGNGVPRELITWLCKYIKQWPDVTFFLDVPLEVAQKRKQSKTMADPAFAQRVEQGYQELADAFYWVRVDANRDPALVAGQCLETIINKLSGPDIR